MSTAFDYFCYRRTISATHVAICTIRMEPVYMMMGDVAGLAAVAALKSGAAVQDIDKPALLKKLREQGGVLTKRDARKVPPTPAI